MLWNWTSSRVKPLPSPSCSLVFEDGENTSITFHWPLGSWSTFIWPSSKRTACTFGWSPQRLQKDNSTPTRLASSAVSPEADVRATCLRSTLMSGNPFHQDSSTYTTSRSPWMWSLTVEMARVFQSLPLCQIKVAMPNPRTVKKPKARSAHRSKVGRRERGAMRTVKLRACQRCLKGGTRPSVHTRTCTHNHPTESTSSLCHGQANVSKNHRSRWSRPRFGSLGGLCHIDVRTARNGVGCVWRRRLCAARIGI